MDEIIFLLEQCDRLTSRIESLLSSRTVDDSYKIENIVYFTKLRNLYEDDLRRLDSVRFPPSWTSRKRKRNRSKNEM